MTYGWEGGRVGGWESGRESGRVGGCEGGRESGRVGGWEGGREGRANHGGMEEIGQK